MPRCSASSRWCARTSSSGCIVVERQLEEHVLQRALLLQLRGRAARDDPAAIDDGDAVAYRLRHGERVRGQEDGLPLVREAAEEAFHLALRERVEADHRL